MHNIVRSGGQRNAINLQRQNLADFYLKRGINLKQNVELLAQRKLTGNTINTLWLFSVAINTIQIPY